VRRRLSLKLQRTLRRTAYLLTPAIGAFFALCQANAANESPLQVAAGSGKLGGVLTVGSPNGGTVILMVPGSGNIDHDENGPGGLHPDTFHELAEGLAAEGVSSVRIDKRGEYTSASAAQGANSVTISDYASDVHSWADEIKRTQHVRCVWVLGHSEGSLVALVAAQNRSDICGLILISGAGRPLGQVLREQLQANPANAPILAQALQALDRLQAGQPVDAANLNPALLPLFRPAVQKFLMNEMSYNPTELIGKVRLPILILQGGRDIQVPVEDAMRLKEAAPNAQLEILATMNHVLKSVPSADRAANLATYTDPTIPLHPDLIPTITKFVRSYRGIEHKQ